jgi:peroxiredoxin
MTNCRIHDIETAPEGSKSTLDVQKLMKTGKFFLVMVMIIISISAFGQLPQKSEDICPLLIGEAIPTNTLISVDGNKHQLSDLIAEKPGILIFYRGGWCPYCNTQLSDLRKIEDEIITLGYQILAISPDSPENLRQTMDKQKPNYSLYSDADGALIKSMGIAFQAPDRHIGMLNKRSEGQNEGFLPVPSVFVVDTSGKILFEYINPDYKTRISSDMLLSVLKSLDTNKK